MVGPDTSLEGGLIAAGALFAANYTLKRLLYKNARLSQILQGEALLLIYNGEIQIQNCAKAEITTSELNAAVREHGVNSVEEVDMAMLEVDGNISIVSKDFQKRSRQPLPRRHKLKGQVLKR